MDSSKNIIVVKKETSSYKDSLEELSQTQTGMNSKFVKLKTTVKNTSPSPDNSKSNNTTSNFQSNKIPISTSKVTQHKGVNIIPIKAININKNITSNGSEKVVDNKMSPKQKDNKLNIAFLSPTSHKSKLIPISSKNILSVNPNSPLGLNSNRLGNKIYENVVGNFKKYKSPSPKHTDLSKATSPSIRK